MSEDQARSLATSQHAFAGYHVRDIRLVLSLDGRVRESNGFVVFTAPGPRLDVAGAAAALPRAFWLVHLESTAQPCSTGLVVIDARSGDVVLTAGGGRRCTQF